MAVLVAGDGPVASQAALVHGLDKGLFADALDEPLGQDDDAVPRLFGLGLDDGADDAIAQVVERDLGAAKLFGDDGERGGGSLADAQGQVPRGPAHADGQVPARRGTGVLGQVANDVHSFLAGGFEAEGWRRTGQRQVVVDGLGNVGDADAPLGPAIDLAAGKGGVVAADGDQGVDVEIAKNVKDVLHVLRGLGGIGVRRAEHGAAAHGLVLDVIGREPADEFAIALDEVLEAVANAVDLHVIIDCFDGDGANNAIDAGSGPAADQKGYPIDAMIRRHESHPPE